VIWVLAIFAAVILRYEFDISRANFATEFFISLGVIALHAVIGKSLGLYSGRHPYGSFEDVRTLAITTLATGTSAAIIYLAFGNMLEVPRSIGFIATPIALIGHLGVRYLRRLYLEKRQAPGADAKRTLIMGAGFVGETVVRRMLTDSKSRYLPVGIIDDNPRKRNFRLRNVRVLGTRWDIPEVAARVGATDLVIAVARADAQLIREVSDIASAVDLNVKVMPLLEDILEGKSTLSDLRDISIEDLIGRRPVDTEVESIASYLSGKRVLVTGAGGSIGSELCRQIAKFAPSELMMLDRDESELQAVQLSIHGHGLLHTRDVVLVDIRDQDALDAIFTDRMPQVVFHAAALKHLPMLEQYPDEAWKTNVIGTLNVLRAAQRASVETFINISTDKAANPTSVLGHSKRVAEKLTAWMAEETGRAYLSVRFGNVIGSRGSMLPTFQQLIENGGPVTVTHPEVTRFFMTIPEACQLVVQAGAIGGPGEVLILDMGEPVRILDIAERMIAMSGKDVSIVFTGLREGEKLHEELIGNSETDERPFHPKITHARVKSITPQRLDKRGWEARMFAQPRNNDTQEIHLHQSRMAEGGQS